MQLVAVLTALGAVGFIDSTLALANVGIAALSGLGMGMGLMLYYTAMARSGAMIAAPIVATLSAIIPFVYAVVAGEPAGVVAIAGAAVAIVGLVLVTGGRPPTGDIGTGTVLAVASGCAYGFGLSILISVDEASGAWTSVIQRTAAFALMVLIARRRRLPLVAPSGTRMNAALAGMLAGTTSLAYVAGLSFDATATVVTGSMFPAASVLVGRVFFADSVRPVQVVGLVVSLAGVLAVVAS
jgi:drug/metabolite transporter (DMT)-like permease